MTSLKTALTIAVKGRTDCLQRFAAHGSSASKKRIQTSTRSWRIAGLKSKATRAANPFRRSPGSHTNAAEDIVAAGVTAQGVDRDGQRSGSVGPGAGVANHSEGGSDHSLIMDVPIASPFEGCDEVGSSRYRCDVVMARGEVGKGWLRPDRAPGSFAVWEA